MKRIRIRSLSAVLVAASALAGCRSELVLERPFLQLNAITQAEGLFVAVGVVVVHKAQETPIAPAIFTSTDGETWSSIAPDMEGELDKVTAGNGRFVASGGKPPPGEEGSGNNALGLVLTSSDGATWSPATLPTDEMVSIAFGDGLFVALDQSGHTWSSSDGVTWAGGSTSLGFTDVPVQHTLVFGDGRFVAGMGDTRIAVSLDGLTWSVGAGPTAAPTFAVAFAGDTFFATVVCKTEACNLSQGLSTSMDGESWGPVVNTDDLVFAVAANHGVDVAVADSEVLRSTDGATWSVVDVPVGSWLGVVASPTGFVVVGTSAILTSDDGQSWKPHDLPLF